MNAPRLVRRRAERRRAWPVLLVVALLVGLAGPAYAFWTATSTGDYALARATGLTAPTLTTGTVTPTTVPLSWNQPFTPTGYTLGQSPGSIAGCSGTPGTGSTSCTATSLTPNTTYTWTLTASRYSWTAPATASATTSRQATTTTLSNRTPTTGPAGTTFNITASVTGNSGYGTPAGTVVFSLYTSSTCSGSPVSSTAPVTTSGGSATGGLTPAAGTYYWRAVYTPTDTYNLTSTSACSAAITVTPSVATYVGTGAATNVTNNNNNVSVAYPAGTQAGDLLLLVVVNGSGEHSTAASPWSLIAQPRTPLWGSMETQAWWRIAGSETSTTMPTLNSSTRGASAWVVAYRKSGSTPALGDVSSDATFWPTGTVTPDSISVTQADTTVVSLVGIDGPSALSLTTARSFNLRESLVVTGGSGRALGVADRLAVGTGTITPPTWSISGSEQWAHITVGFTWN